MLAQFLHRGGHPAHAAAPGGDSPRPERRQSFLTPTSSTLPAGYSVPIEQNLTAAELAKLDF